MTTQPPHTHRPIAQHQNEPDLLQARAAARLAHGRAGRIRTAQTFGAVGLALFAPLLLIFWPDASDILATVAVVWLLAARTALDAWHRRTRLQAVHYQELFDTILFDLPWNTSLAGLRRLVRETVAARTRPLIPKDHGWYENVPDVPWPLDALACQTQNLMWTRRNHRSYARLLWTILALTALAAALLAAAQDLTLGQGIIQLAVPLTPALLDLAELPRRHLDAAHAQEQLEEAIDDLLAQRTAGHPVTTEDCREIQDGIFERRAHQPPVPTLVHSRLRTASSAAATARMRDLHHELTQPQT
ncbi:S-4TM family putative pore-forming effector [Streptomyces canus]|uniref:S-4TM family putative pore-forming effector n=1 Tax=Streptomyces canus TaxID=58343 RepID=UPI0038646F71|nr:S-4TM family putative pore-forming effector [Streptomyces canus]